MPMHFKEGMSGLWRERWTVAGKEADFQQGLHSKEGYSGDAKRQPPPRTSQRQMQLSSDDHHERRQKKQSSREWKQRSLLGISLP